MTITNETFEQLKRLANLEGSFEYQIAKSGSGAKISIIKDDIVLACYEVQPNAFPQKVA